MHDLNTINRLNAEAFAKSIANFRAQGRFVLARYEGLHLNSIETFSTLESAQLILDVTPANSAAGERAVIYTPTAAFHAAQRDQSEDRKQLPLEEIARLGAGQPVHTLSQYLATKA